MGCYEEVIFFSFWVEYSVDDLKSICSIVSFNSEVPLLIYLPG
jgi:hypothetical protein